MNKLPNFITLGRLAAALLLIFLTPFTLPFHLVYVLCGIGDIADGWLARRLMVESRTGATLDSLADLTFFLVALVRLVPGLPIESWMLYWTGGIVLVRAVTLAAGWTRWRVFAWLHTWANKTCGLLLFCFPFFFRRLGLPTTACILCAAATLAALEELLITLTRPHFDADAHGFFLP